MFNEDNLKKGLFIFILAILSLPLIQFTNPFFEEATLNGYFETSDKPAKDSLIADWLSGNYQIQYDNYFSDSVGFKNTFVRIFNQTQYSLFNKTTAKKVQVGKENYLYETGYINDYMGFNFIGENIIKKKLLGLKKVQEELKKENIHLIVGFAPGKASYYPEYLPTRYDTSKRTISNYLCYTQYCEELKLVYIDFNAMFMNQKRQSNIPLYPKNGIHWGEYGVAMALDTLSKYIEQISEIIMPSIEMEKLVYYDTILEPDRDIGDAMNLLEELDFYKMPTPIGTVKRKNNDVKLKLLIIGDSYGYGLTNSPFITEQFSNVEFWYYNKQIKPRRKNHSNMIADINVHDELKKFDVVLLLSSEVNLYRFDFDFTDRYNIGNNSQSQLEKEIQKVIKNIKENEEWFELTKIQAEEMGISLRDVLRRNAVFVIKQRNK